AVVGGRRPGRVVARLVGEADDDGVIAEVIAVVQVVIAYDVRAELEPDIDAVRGVVLVDDRVHVVDEIEQILGAREEIVDTFAVFVVDEAVVQDLYLHRRRSVPLLAVGATTARVQLVRECRVASDRDHRRRETRVHQYLLQSSHRRSIGWTGANWSIAHGREVPRLPSSVFESSDRRGGT